ncbi:PPIC-type PPIASE domain protein [uncultured Desulfobacterium sp.]|uniref:Periplasmic chaperone PpiD n=1 Tax=uncultured Desulfobacterium sp. TaxID=201089 RepID=A0A445MR50_9BACT|nr:PPIC-type PPIASE domain protein [uncultured Desulfobacterium sp.]
MILSLMRKHAQSWLIKTLMFIIAVVFIFYFGYSFTARRGLKTAYVNGDLITTEEYRKAYGELVESLQRQYKDMWNEEIVKALDLKNQALTNLINERLINQEAERLGLEVTEKEIQQAIQEYSVFQVNGRFDMGQYRAMLNRNRMKPEDFEAAISKDMLGMKLKQFLYSFSEVTDQEVLDNYTFNNEKIKVSFIQVKRDAFKKSVSTDEASIKDFFEKNREKYRVPDQIKFAYVVIDPKSFEQGIKTTEDEIKNYYEDNLSSFKEERKVKASHILFKLDAKATGDKENEVKEKAESVLKEVRDGKDFAELAKKYSDCPSKAKGGDLGYFSEGQMVKPFEEAAFKLKAGEISDLVRTEFGFHIIKVEDVKEARTRPLEEVRGEIVETLIHNASLELAYEKGQTLIDQMPYDADLSQYVTGQGLEAKFTDYLASNQPIPGIQGDKKLLQGIFSLAKGEVSELLELGEKYYIFQAADKKASYLPELAEVLEKVKSDLTDDLAAKAAKTEAEALLADLQKGRSWDDLAKEKQLQIEQTDFFSRQGAIPKIGYEPELQEKLFRLNEGKRYPDTVFENSNGAFLIRWEGYQGIDQAKFQGEKEKQRLSLMQKKHSRLFEDWLYYLKARADIKIITPP